jgi:FkbM family methyltransferase
LIHAVTAAFASDHPRAVVIEVGAHDGIQRDPLRRHVLTCDWTTYLLEPVPAVFEKLQRNVRFVDGAHPVNVAIAGQDRPLPFFQVRPPEPGEEVWPWYDALGSFDREVVLSHVEQIPDIAERIVSVDVPALTARTFLADHAIDRVDLLQIDTEGYDLVVLEQFDIASLQPFLVIYEHWHLDDDQRGAAERLLASAGYELRSEGLDTIAMRRDRACEGSSAMGRAWQHHR